ncbi:MULTISPECIES: LysR family transcriptional regulator [Cupriavidus]|uniref:LysR family transcriptional regulator n=1 Tax=Cupriavidus taiwanensis TaxID=164546 RepID=A0A375D7T1_9BURK|nr:MULTISPECIES: LysR family transcriptional regulator [Cupriavidus]MEC3767465.1 LysR family transcriptional regulator [Cupriavidus sp. SS-3]SOY94560.1 Transcriptional regulator, LysR family [Cupriavidus taiwanensis]SOY98608.1 Transcriptional regulator, LysR family [Cupriavidus taiwanensis]SPD66693.1 LysR family transcriptional regulator [Cupriavidus taiwanensis]
MRQGDVEGLWEHLHWLMVLHQQGSFSKAAARLGVSKASMSQHIADLERSAGIMLVQRTTRSATLTDAGRQLVDSMRGAFEQISAGFANVRDLAGAPRGLLRVTAPVAFSRQQLVPRLPEFLRQYPQIQIELDMSDRLRSLAQEGYDIAVRHTTAPPETHVAWTLSATRIVLVASRSYLRANGTPEIPEALVDHACLHYPRQHGTATWTFVRTGPDEPSTHADPVTVAVNGPLAVNNSEALRDAAIEGLGIALLPDFSAQSALDTGRLIEVLPEWRATGAFGDWLYAIRPYSAHASRVSQVFVDYLRESFSKGFTSTPPALV